MSRSTSTCPFCESSEHLQVDNRNRSFYVLCEPCGSQGPRRWIFKDTVADWDKLSNSVSLIRYNRAVELIEQGVA